LTTVTAGQQRIAKGRRDERLGSSLIGELIDPDPQSPLLGKRKLADEKVRPIAQIVFFRARARDNTRQVESFRGTTDFNRWRILRRL
jgi:hypothetical protein